MVFIFLGDEERLAQVPEPRYAECWNGEAWVEGGSSDLRASKSCFGIPARGRSQVARRFRLDSWPVYAASSTTGCRREEPIGLAFR